MKPLDFIFSFVLFMAFLLLAVAILVVAYVSFSGDPEGTINRLTSAVSSNVNPAISLIMAEPLYLFGVVLALIVILAIILKKFVS